MNRNETIKAILENKIIVILRGLNLEELISTVGAIREGGIRCCEVTYDSKGTPTDEETASYIKTLVEKFPDMHIGAGTVLTEKQVELTAKAGGEYIISPDTNPDVIRKTRELGLVSIPGSLTPSEATLANRCGADFVKLFPNGEMKPSYVKAVSVPLSHIRFLAVGGVNENNAKDYLANGAVGIGVANGIINKTMIKEGRFEELTLLAKKYTEAVK